MSLLNKAKLDIKLGQYAVGSVAALTDPHLVSRAQDYRRHIASRMIPFEPDDIVKRLPAADYHVSLKVDGEFNLLVFDKGEIVLVNPGGTVRTGLALLRDAAEQLQKAGVKKAIIAGELYYLKAIGKRPRVHDVSRVARQPASQAEIDDLAFGAFDIIDVDGVGPSATIEQTWKRLTALFGGGKRCNVVESTWLNDASEIEAQFRKWIEQGAEGAVIRSDAAGSFKVKPLHTVDAVVIGYTEGTDDRKGMIHDLLVALVRTDGCLHVIGHVGGGFDEKDRRGFLSDLKDMTVASDYVEVNDQVAYHMVKPEWIIEVSVLDLISRSTRGLPINKMALHYNSAEKRYQNVRRLPSVGLISPQFIRKREDKNVSPLDIGMDQVTEIVEVQFADRDARKLDLPRSEVLRREVCIKVLKGQTMVRKLIMWQTNKESEGADFPAYVVHHTDFSPNRKTPLERDIRVSNSREQIEELWNELAAEAFTKGWVPVGGAPASPAAGEQAAVKDSTALAAEAKPKRGTKAEPVTETGVVSEEPTKAPAKKRAAEEEGRMSGKAHIRTDTGKRLRLTGKQFSRNPECGQVRLMVVKVCRRASGDQRDFMSQREVRQ